MAAKLQLLVSQKPGDQGFVLILDILNIIHGTCFEDSRSLDSKFV